MSFHNSFSQPTKKNLHCTSSERTHSFPKPKIVLSLIQAHMPTYLSSYHVQPQVSKAKSPTTTEPNLYNPPNGTCRVGSEDWRPSSYVMQDTRQVPFTKTPVLAKEPNLSTLLFSIPIFCLVKLPKRATKVRLGVTHLKPSCNTIWRSTYLLANNAGWADDGQTTRYSTIDHSSLFLSMASLSIRPL